MTILYKAVSTRYTMLLLLCAGLMCSSCRQPRHHRVARGCYYWKTICRPTAAERQKLQALGVQRIYLRLFDIDLDPVTHHAIPIAPVQLPAPIGGAADIVPVVFITQQTLAQLPYAQAPRLAQQIAGLMSSICTSAGIRPAELQIDCDWTAGTRDIYFGLLSELKRQPYFSGKALSCTIRLHQVKYFGSSGIPPADNGMLMCYSMGNIKKYGPHNSILDVAEAKRYANMMDAYPLPLDIALPLFQWCVLFRQQQYRGILHDVTPEMVTASILFAQKQNSLYACLRDTVWHGYNIAAGDVIRIEAVPAAELEEIARYTSPRLKKQELNVAFFSCDSITLAKYSTHELETIYHIYQ